MHEQESLVVCFYAIIYFQKQKMRLIGIQIFDNTLPEIRKSLYNVWYPFLKCKHAPNTDGSDFPEVDEDAVCPSDFFRIDERLPEVNVSVVVGKNGTGKSSLLDILFRLINNLAYTVLNRVDVKKSASLKYADGMHARLYFEVDGCTGFIESDWGMTSYYGKKADGSSGLIDIGQFRTMDEVHSVLDGFFYTIIVNYSLYSLNEYDYPHVHMTKENRTIQTGKWIPYLFHKNDGYLTPIVVTPFRDKGTINIQGENNLAIRRLAILCILFRANGYRFIDDYEAVSISYQTILNYEHTHRNEFQEKLRYRELSKILPLFYKHFEEAWNKILLDQNIHLEELNFSNKDLALTVLAIKSTKICLTYAYFFDLLKIQSVIDKAEDDPEWLQYYVTKDGKELPNAPIGERKKSKTVHFEEWLHQDTTIFVTMAREILNDTTHVTAKARNIYNYLLNGQKYYGEGGDPMDKEARYYASAGGFNLDRFIEENDCSTYEKVEALMPPSFFSMDLGMRRVNKDGEEKGEVSVRSMSSGERQLLYSLSYVYYHLHNLQSIRKNTYRVPYHHVNLVFDETELYYHPEFQRQYLKRLLHALSYCNLTKENVEDSNAGFIRSINILLITHSPFLLSDIPYGNVLFMKRQGEDREPQKTFGGNVYDLLNNGFFMDSAMGDVATDKVRRLAEVYYMTEGQGNAYRAERVQLRFIAENVADEYLVRQCRMMIERLESKYPEA